MDTGQYLLSVNPLSTTTASYGFSDRRHNLGSFNGQAPITLVVLIEIRGHVIFGVVGGKPQAHRQFLISFEARGPNWPLLQLPIAQTQPAARGRVENLAKLSQARRTELVESLKRTLTRDAG